MSKKEDKKSKKAEKRGPSVPGTGLAKKAEKAIRNRKQRMDDYLDGL